MNYLINTLMPLPLEHRRQQVVLLGDGFFARGFLRYIDHGKYHVTQLYRDKFLNPQDMMYALQANEKYTEALHLRDLFTRKPEVKIQTDIKSLKIADSECNINGKPYYFDHLVVGLGAAKPLTEWRDTLNNINANKQYAVVGMGPTGMEIASILSKKMQDPVHLYDMLPINKVIGYVSTPMKIKLLSNSNIKFHFGEGFKANKDEEPLYCVGTRPNSLTENWKVSNLLMLNEQVHIGGDCANTEFYKTGQVAYQQGVYVAKKLNGEIPVDEPFVYKPQGIALNVGDNKAIVEGHPYVPDGVYPAFIIKLYSLFFI
jgi:NADH dehydrogenase FAD-containing subunit